MTRFDLDGRERSKGFAAYLKGLEDRIAALERGNPLTHASIEGGALDVYDDEGTLRASLGVQEDGTVGVQVVNSDPPPTPTAPLLEEVLAGFVVTWDGAWADADATPGDISLVQVHVGPDADFIPGPTTLASTITNAAGGTVSITVAGYSPVWVRLVALNTAAMLGEPSAATQGTPRKAVSDDLVDGIITEIKLAQNAVTQTKIAVGAVGSVALADAAVLTEKLADNAVKVGKVGGALADSVTQRWIDTMTDPGAWQVTTQGTGATWGLVSGVADAPTGRNVGQARGFVRLRGTALMPYEPGTLYRISARVRLTAPSSGTETFYVGALGVAGDQTTLVNRAGENSASMHYYCAAAGRAIAAADGWITVVGFLRDRGPAGSAGPNSDPRSPGLVHTGVRYIAPYVWLNYSSELVPNSGSTMQVDTVTIEALKTGVVDAINITAGAVTTAALAAGAITAEKVAAGAITAEKLTIVGSPNVLPDPSFEGAATTALAARYTYTAHDKTFGSGSPASLRLDATSATAVTRAVELTLLPITAGDQLYLATDYYPSNSWTGTEVSIHAQWERADGTVLGHGKAAATAPAKGTWGRLSGTVTAPAGATQARIRLESTAGTAGSVWWDNAAVRPLVPGVQIADGAITAPKILTGAVTTDKLDALAVTAEKIAALAITTDKLDALAVTAQKIAANAIEATHIKAGAIATGHLAADAITGKTITGGEINGTIVTGALVRTATSGRRLALDPNGLGSGAGALMMYSGHAEERAPGRLHADVHGSTGAGVSAMTAGNGLGAYLDLKAPDVGTSSASLRLESPAAGSGGGFTLSDGIIPSIYLDASASDAAREGRFEIHVEDDDASPTGGGMSTYLASGKEMKLEVSAAAGGINRLILKPDGTTMSQTLTVQRDLDVAGFLTAGNIAFGSVLITPTAANSPTAAVISGLNVDGTTFRAWTGANSSVPGTSVLGTSANNLSSTGLTVWLTRANTATTTVWWLMIGL